MASMWVFPLAGTPTVGNDSRAAPWSAVRDRCPVGRAYRYSDEQIAYHYTKDPQFLPARDRPARSG